MRALHTDLHMHICPSPCAEREMSPLALVRQARERGLDLIAICDHDSAENVEAVGRAAQRIGLAVIGDMEITSREEAHVLGPFREHSLLNAAQGVVYDNLQGENDPDTFGEQLVMDEHDKVVGHNRRLLIGATDLTLGEVVRTVHEFGGVAIASHVDRPTFSIPSQLGFIPEGLGLDGVEVCFAGAPGRADGLPVICSSDAHRLSEIGTRRTRFLVEDATASEIEMALRGAQGRRVVTAQ